MRLCEAAALIAVRTGARSLDALHLAAAVAVGRPTVVSYDERLGAAARELGLDSVAP
jgi:predicted nucleic acid-binding protein